MMAGGGVLGGDAIPGDPAALDSLVSQLVTTVGHVDSIRGRVASQGLGGAWSGAGADAFRASLHQLPGELEKIGASFTAAADALRAFASTLAELQHRAVWLASQITDVEHHAQQAEMRHANAQAQLRAAHQANAAAVDPVSKSSAQHAVHAASSAVAMARAAQDELHAEVSNLRAAASANHAEWEQAASLCAGRLDAASHLGIRNTLGSWFERNVAHGLGGLVVGGERLFRKARDEALREAKKHGVGAIGKFFDRLATDARGRPMSLARALLHGSVLTRIANVGRYIEKAEVRVVHRVWNGAWAKLGVKHLKPPWTKVTKPVAKLLGHAAAYVQPAFEAVGEVRKGNYGGAIATVSAAVLTKNPVVGVVDAVTGSSVSGFVKIAVETPTLLFSGEKGANDFSQRIESGHYGPLPQWEAKYVSKPLENFIYDNLMAH